MKKKLVLQPLGMVILLVITLTMSYGCELMGWGWGVQFLSAGVAGMAISRIPNDKYKPFILEDGK